MGREEDLHLDVCLVLIEQGVDAVLLLLVDSLRGKVYLHASLLLDLSPELVDSLD